MLIRQVAGKSHHTGNTLAAGPRREYLHGGALQSDSVIQCVWAEVCLRPQARQER